MGKINSTKSLAICREKLLKRILSSLLGGGKMKKDK
jgi:hypothetical protein